MADNALLLRKCAQLFASDPKHLRWGIALGGLIAALLVTLVSRPMPLLVWNATLSAPIGLYAVDPWRPVEVGAMVVAWIPSRWRKFAEGRRYLRADVSERSATGRPRSAHARRPPLVQERPQTLKP